MGIDPRVSDEDILISLTFWADDDRQHAEECNGRGCLTCLHFNDMNRAIDEIQRLRAEG